MFFSLTQNVGRKTEVRAYRMQAGKQQVTVVLPAASHAKQAYMPRYVQFTIDIQALKQQFRPVCLPAPPLLCRNACSLFYGPRGREPDVSTIQHGRYIPIRAYPLTYLSFVALTPTT